MLGKKVVSEAANPSQALGSQQPVATVTTLGAGVSFTGRLSGRGDAEIFGSLEGPIGIEGRAVVRKGARCVGDIEARNVAVEGEVIGDLRARDKVELLPTARVSGNVWARRLSIHEGARLEGRVVMDELGKPVSEITVAEPSAPREEPTAAALVRGSVRVP